MEDKTHSLYIRYSQQETGGEVCAGQEDEAYADHEDSFIVTEFLYVDRNPVSSRYGEGDFIDNVSLEVYNADVVYVAVVKYSTGDTFSHTEGKVYLEGAYLSHEDAEEALEIARTVTDFSVPWNGYFEHLDDSFVERLEVKGPKK